MPDVAADAEIGIVDAVEQAPTKMIVAAASLVNITFLLSRQVAMPHGIRSHRVTISRGCT
jgi:hypothetical protein